jgi:hypothetical protein
MAAGRKVRHEESPRMKYAPPEVVSGCEWMVEYGEDKRNTPLPPGCAQGPTGTARRRCARKRLTEHMEYS